MGKVQGQDRNQHEQATELGEKEKFYRGICAVLTPPDSDQKVHGDEHQFPREVKKKEVEREEDAEDSSENP
jgi:hypothetical protein